MFVTHNGATVLVRPGDGKNWTVWYVHGLHRYELLANYLEGPLNALKWTVAWLSYK
jgi:hypothetical protein